MITRPILFCRSPDVLLNSGIIKSSAKSTAFSFDFSLVYEKQINIYIFIKQFADCLVPSVRGYIAPRFHENFWVWFIRDFVFSIIFSPTILLVWRQFDFRRMDFALGKYTNVSKKSLSLTDFGIVSSKAFLFKRSHHRVAQIDRMSFIFVRHLSQKSPIISGSFAERDLHLKALYASPPSCSVHGTERYGTHEQDLPSHIKR